MARRITVHVRILATLLLALVGLQLVAAATTAPADATREFGVKANSDAMRGMPVEELAPMMKDVGFDHVAISVGADQFDRHIEAYREADIHVGAVYVGWTTDGDAVRFNIPIDQVIDRLRGTDAIIMIHTHVAKGKTVSDERIAEQLRPLADQAQAAGLTVAIYPHVGNRLATAAHAAKISAAVDHPALGICFNLCHFLKQNAPERLTDTLREVIDQVRLVTINGSAVGDTQKMGWDKLIQPIDEGQFDLAALLELVCEEHRFKGPIYVQCYNVKAPAREVLVDTHKRWQQLRTICEPTK